MRSDREKGVVILYEEFAILEREFEFAAVERLPERPAQNWEEDFAIEAARGRVPVYVEECSVGRWGTVLEDIHPPSVLHARGHVVRHDVKHQAHASFLQLVLESVEFFFRPQFEVNSGWIGNVIAVPAAFSTAQNRRN